MSAVRLEETRSIRKTVNEEEIVFLIPLSYTSLFSILKRHVSSPNALHFVSLT